MAPEGREAVDYDGEVFYLRMCLDPAYIEGFVEGCLERISEDNREGENLLRSELEEGDRDMVIEILKAGCDVRAGRPEWPT
jgi:hypothetical protein